MCVTGRVAVRAGAWLSVLTGCCSPVGVVHLCCRPMIKTAVIQKHRTGGRATAWQRAWVGLLALFLAGLLAGCATGPKLVPHAFSFDGRKDGWHETVDLLAYSYGDQYHKVRRSLESPSSSLFAGLSGLPSGHGVNGPMPVGEFLYVKWRIKATGEVLEDRVDLRGRLPKDMSDHELTFVIDGRQLFVFVVTPERKKAYGEPPLLKTWRSNFARAYEIYPQIEPRGGR